MNALAKKALSDVTRRKLRTALTVLGIAIGVMGLTAINITSDQLNSSLQYTLDQSSQPDITFFTAPANPQVAQILAQQPNVKIAQAEGFAGARWHIPSGHFTLDITGLVDPSNVRIGTFQVLQGSLPGPGEILLESGDRAIQSVNVGDTITVQVGRNTYHLKVSGFARTRGQTSPQLTQTATGYMRQSDLQSLFGSPGVNVFLIQLNDYSQRASTAKALAAVLATQHVQILSVSVGRQSASSPVLNGLFSVMQALSIIALLLSFFLLLSTITTLLSEQVPIIGTMKAIGAGRGQIVRNYLTSVAIYGIIGSVAGLVLGALGGFLLFNYFASLVTIDVGPLTLNPAIVALAIVVGLGVPLLVAILPIYLGTRITVRQALSGYGLDSGSSGGSLAAIGRAFGFLPQTIQLGVRSMFRKRTRAFLTVLALAISGAAFLAVQTTAFSFGSVLNGLFDTYHADVLAAVSQPTSLGKIQTTLANVPNIARIEAFEQHAIVTAHGSGLLTGVSPDTQLYHYSLTQGRWFTAADTNVVLVNTNAASKFHIGPGDSVTFHDDLRTATWKVIGVTKDFNDPIGFGVLVAPLAQVNAFLGFPADFTTELLIKANDTSPAAINTLATTIDNTLANAGYQDSVSTVAQIKQANESQFQIIYDLLYTVAVIIALVGAIGLFNSLAMSILERRREIGILRSMGATGARVAQVFLTEGVSLGVVAWVVAVILGIPAAFAFVQFLGAVLIPVPFAFDPTGLISMLVFIVVVALLASLGPVWAASRVKIAQTLRYE